MNMIQSLNRMNGGQIVICMRGIIPLVAAYALLAVSCGTKDAQQEFTLGQVLEGLKAHTSPMVFGKETGPAMLIAPSLGARVLALSPEGLSGKNLFWLNDAVFNPEFWKDGPEWNAGGLRSWLAPEVSFFLDSENVAFMPEALDPGAYSLVNSSGTMAVFSNDILLRTRDGIEYHCILSREIHLLESYQWPEMSAVPEGVRYAGVRVVHSLENAGNRIIGEDIPYIGLWSILQVQTPGTMIIPVTDVVRDGDAWRYYFDPAPADWVADSGDAFTVRIDGRRRFKIGFAPEYSAAAIAYISLDAGGNGTLFIKQFMVDPNGVYVDGPPEIESDNGDAVQLYNDDGNYGGFAELECHGPAQKMKPGEKESHDVRVHVFTGPAAALKDIISRLLRVDSAKLKYF